MTLLPIEQPAPPHYEGVEWPEIVTHVCESYGSLYAASGVHRPWIGYLAVEEGACVGTCGFKGPPVDGRVEIAYFTFPAFEGRGVATRMARELIGLTRNTAPDMIITAQTLAEENASTRILRNLGFHLLGEVDHPEDGVIWEWTMTSELE